MHVAFATGPTWTFCFNFKQRLQTRIFYHLAYFMRPTYQLLRDGPSVGPPLWPSLLFGQPLSLAILSLGPAFLFGHPFAFDQPLSSASLRLRLSLPFGQPLSSAILSLEQPTPSTANWGGPTLGPGLFLSRETVV